MYSSNKEHNYSAKKLYNLIKSGNVDLVGISYTVGSTKSNILPETYIDNVNSENGNFEFEGHIFAHERDRLSLNVQDNILTESGLGYIKTEELDNSFTEGNLMSDLLMRGTNVSTIKKVTIGATFVDPEVTYQSFTLGGYKFKLFCISEYSVLTEIPFAVYMLITEKTYDGQTILGMLSQKDKLSKKDTKDFLNLIISDKEYTPIINREFPGAYYDDNDVAFNLYNTNKTGIYFFLDATEQVFTIGCGQSSLRVNWNDIQSSSLDKVKDDAYELTIQLKKNKELTIFF